MELNINSPSYYTQNFGVIDEIYWLCRDLSLFVKNKQYSDFINIIGITPIIAPDSIIEKGLCKDVKKVELKYGFAAISLKIDFNEYVNSNLDGKKLLIVNNILQSIKAIHKRAKFDYIRFENDIYSFCEIHNIKIK